MATSGRRASGSGFDPRLASFVEDGSGINWEGETWSFEKKLGSGRFATVYALACSTNATKQKVAAKVTTLAGISPWARAQLTEELAIWQTLRHPNVVRLHGHLSDAKKHVLLLELAKGGELFERIVSMQFFSEQLAASQVAQVLSALEYLHSFGVLHRDLKPENLLLETPEDDSRVKIADFGASKLVISSGAKTPCGSLGYAAPEQLRGLKFAQDPAYVLPYDKEVDLWSVGVITYILLSGSMPFDPATYSAEALASDDALDFPPSLFAECSAEAIAFIRALLQALQESGLLKKAWDYASEAARKGQPVEAAIGAEGDEARAIAKKRTAEVLEEEREKEADVPELMLPPEVSKRIRMASEESNASVSSAGSAAGGS